MPMFIPKTPDPVVVAQYAFDTALSSLATMYVKGRLDSIEVRMQPPFTRCTVERNGIAKVPLTMSVVFHNRDKTPTWGMTILLLLKSIVAESLAFTVIIVEDDKHYLLDKDLSILEEWTV